MNAESRTTSSPVLDEVCQLCWIPEHIRGLSKKIFEEFTHNRVVKADISIGIQATCMYYGFLHSGAARSILEICNIFSISENIFTKSDKIFRDHYRDTPSSFFKFRELFESADAEDLISRHVPKLLSITEISARQRNSIRNSAVLTVQNIRARKMLVSKTTGAIASAAIYLALAQVVGKTIKKAPFCKAVGLTSSVTLQTILKELDILAFTSECPSTVPANPRS